MDFLTYEDELQFLIDKVEGVNEYNWSDAISELNLNIHPDHLRKSFNGGRYSGYAVAKYYQDKLTDFSTEEEIKRLEQTKFELTKERKKVQSVNLEYHENARSEGRYELYLEQIKDAVDKLPPIIIKPSVYKKQPDETIGVVYIADAHVGRDVTMYGLFGEIINHYDIKEFETRMWNLLNQMENDFYDMKIDRLDICDLGDNIEGILRLGESLKNLKTGVVDSTIYYAEFMANWICECYNRLQIPIRYSLTSGNHDTLRILQSKPCFEQETVGKFIYNHISLRIENSKLKAKINDENIDIELEPYNDVSYHNYYGMNVLCYHGDGKNLKEDLEFFSNYYNIDIDIIVGGHLHRNSSETVGMGYMGDKEIVRVLSICGNDTFSKNIRKSSRAGARFMTFTENGLGWGKTYWLN